MSIRFIFLVILALSCNFAYSQVANPERNEDGRTITAPRRPERRSDLAKPSIKLAMFKDLPAISCDVCKIAVEVMYNKAAQLRSSAPFNTIDEMEIENKVVDDICNYDKNKNGEWIRQCDVYEKTENGQKYLGVKRNNGMQKCDAECVTIAKSCRDLISDVEYDKLGEALFQNKKIRDQTQNKTHKTKMNVIKI